MRRRRGASFLEIILGLVILTIAIFPMMSLSIVTTKGTKVGLDEIEATNATMAVLESLQAVPWDYLEELYGDPGTPVEDLPPRLLEAMRLAPSPENCQVFVSILHSSLPPLRGEERLDPAAAARIELLRAVRLLEVRCRFRTRSLDDRVGGPRYREVELSTLVSRAGRL
jgi:hypothetical protein